MDIVTSRLMNESLITIDLEARDWQDVLKKMGNKMIESGYARDTFVEALIRREEEFPTGLPTEPIKVAVPHADAQHIIKPAIHVATLREPVIFGEMGKKNEFIPCEIVFMLCIKNPEEQIKLLQKFMNIFTRGDMLLTIKRAKEPKKILEIVNEYMERGGDEND